MGKRGKKRGKKIKEVHKTKRKQKPQRFKEDNGNIIDPIELIFPIVRKIAENNYECVGTGFFVHPAGGFVTAKHCLYNGNEYDDHCYAIHTITENRHIMRKIIYFQGHPVADIGMGMLGGELRNLYTGEVFLKAALPISNSPIKLGEKLASFGYPRMKIDRANVATFPCDKFSGDVLERLPNGTGWLKGECYATSIHIKSGASGGPVLRGFHVVGVNSTAYDGPIDAPATSFITPSHFLFDLELIDSDGTKVTVKELMESGHMAFVD